MKILMLVPFLPNTSTSGGQTRWYNIIKYMSARHEITLFSLIKDDTEKKFIDPLKKYCNKVRVFRRTKSPWDLRNLLLTAFSFYPLLVIRNWSPKEKKAIKKELEKGNYDVIHAETFYVMPHIPKTKVPSIMVEQTIEYQVYKHYVDNEIHPILRPFFMIDVVKLRFWETYFWKKATKAVAVSPDDKSRMQELVPGLKVDVIPNGVDSTYYSEKKYKKLKPPRVLYGVSNFEWLQNQEAVRLLVNKVWPIIIRGYPSIKLWIVGRKMPKWINELGEKRKDIEVTENILDTREAYGGSSVMVTPIKGSGGTRLKILEAMAAGLPIVSTSVGIAGLGVQKGKHVLTSDTCDGLAKEALKILKNGDLARKIGESGRKFVRENYDWREIVKLHDPIYEEITKRN